MGAGIGRMWWLRNYQAPQRHDKFILHLYEKNLGPDDIFCKQFNIKNNDICFYLLYFILNFMLFHVIFCIVVNKSII